MASELMDISRRVARIDDGPIGKVLDKYWDKIHDLESDLEEAQREYDLASSYHGNGQQDSEYMKKEIQNIIDTLNGLSMKSFSRLLEKESVYIKKLGTPEKYVEKRRSEIFPK